MSYIFIFLPLRSPWSVKGSFYIQPCWDLLDYLHRPWVWKILCWCLSWHSSVEKQKHTFALCFWQRNLTAFSCCWIERYTGEAGRLTTLCFCSEVFCLFVFVLRSHQLSDKPSRIRILWILQNKHHKHPIYPNRFEGRCACDKCPHSSSEKRTQQCSREPLQTSVPIAERTRARTK